MFDNTALARLLAEADAAETEGKLGGGDFEELPNGEYYSIIEEAIAKLSKKGNAMIQFTLKITSGEYVGRKHWVYFNLEGVSEMSMKIAIEQLDTLVKDLGLIEQESKITDYEIPTQVLPNLLDQEVRFIIKTNKKGYTNTYIKAM